MADESDRTGGGLRHLRRTGVAAGESVVGFARHQWPFPPRSPAQSHDHFPPRSPRTGESVIHCAGESVAEIVAGAWDFERINRRYARHLKILGERPGGVLRNDAAAKALLRRAATEREPWLEAVTNDPLLPGWILPPEYPGQPAWRRRVEVLRDASRQLRTFKPE